MGKRDEQRSLLPGPGDQSSSTPFNGSPTLYGSTVPSSGVDCNMKSRISLEYWMQSFYLKEYIEQAKLIGLLCCWYFLNVMYNLDNKHSLNMLPLPWTVSTFQLMFGWAFFSSAWLFGLRSVPTCHSKSIFFTCIVPQGVCHFLVHIGAVVSMRCGAVSFTHIVKALEPVLTAAFSMMFLSQIFSWQTYSALIPVVLGVMMASVTELSFTWASFLYSMISNLGSSSRAIIAKRVMNNRDQVGTNLTSANMYALLTIVATCISIPGALLVEGPIIMDVWNEATGPNSPYTAYDILYKMCLSGFWYYTYNEIAYLCLERVNQVTHAVANTLKRVVIIVASIIVFQTPVSAMGAAGSTIAITGTLLYSLCKQKYG